MKNKYDFRILIIDDNAEIHKDFIKILTNETPKAEVINLRKMLFGDNAKEVIVLPEFQIDVASQGQEGIKKINDAQIEGNPYALVFVDVRMPPGWDGVETAKHIIQLDENIQIVICTAYSDYTWEETVNSVGKTDNLLILKKPFDYSAVRQLACALTKKWQLLKENTNYTKTQKSGTESLQHSLSFLKAALDSSTDGIVVVDEKGTILDYNLKLMVMWQLPLDAAKTDFSNLLVHLREKIIDPQKFLNDIIKSETHSKKSFSGTLYCDDDKIYEYYSQPQLLDHDNLVRVYTFKDITTRMHLESKLQHQATHDRLTDLPNRVYLEVLIKSLIESSEQNHEKFSVILINLDRFKQINDSLNHSSGDELLCIIAKRIKKIMRENDVIAHIGGDEFAVIVNNIKNKNVVKTIATNILAKVTEPLLLCERKITITASAGISLYPGDGETVELLLHNADAALSFAKQEGANQFRFYTEELNKKCLELLEKEIQLRQAIINNELTLTYQPQIDLKSKKILSAEVLVRWQHPEAGLMLPDDFIPLAEKTGLILSLGEWVLRNACQQNKDWQNQGLPPIRIAVNLSSQQVNHPHLGPLVKKILKETKLEPKYLELEITENTIINNRHVIATINELKALGIQISLDDFGTGYSSLSYLKDINFDRLKIDKTFIHNIANNHVEEAIILAIIMLAKNLNLKVLGEGVETIAQLNFLEKHQCEEVQGFYFSKAVTKTEFEKILQDPDIITRLKSKV